MTWRNALRHDDVGLKERRKKNDKKILLLYSIFPAQKKQEIVDQCWGSDQEKVWAVNMRNWFLSRKSAIYKTRSTQLRDYLNRETQSTIERFPENEIEIAFNHVLELAVGDLLNALFSESQGINIRKTSPYDDINAWIDYIWVSPDGLIWIDLKLIPIKKEEDKALLWIRQDADRSVSKPFEFSHVSANTRWRVAGGFKSTPRLHMKDSITIPRYVYALDRTMIYLFVQEYFLSIKLNGISDKNTVKRAREKAKIKSQQLNDIEANKEWLTITADIIANTQRTLLRLLAS